MSALAPIITEVDTDTLAAIATMAADRGISTEQLAGDMIRQAVADEEEAMAAIREGRRQIAAGEGMSHEQLLADLRRWKRERRHAA